MQVLRNPTRDILYFEVDILHISFKVAAALHALAVRVRETPQIVFLQS